MSLAPTLLIVPPNDPEAVQIYQLAKAMKLPFLRSGQPHGASIDREKDILKKVRESGADRVVIVEMPGLKTEETIRKMGKEVVIIDHHHYTDLDRAHHPKTHRLLRSSLEQFLSLFRITDAKLKKLGFDPWMVRAVGISDRGYVWAVRRETKCSWKKIQELQAYEDALMASVHGDKNESTKREQAKKAWDKRKTWQGYAVVEHDSMVSMRSRISRITIAEVGKPTPLILVEHKRGFIYVQESPYSSKMFDRFGGFTFGMDLNWGHKNEKGKKQVTLDEVKQAILEMKKKRARK